MKLRKEDLLLIFKTLPLIIYISIKEMTPLFNFQHFVMTAHNYAYKITFLTVRPRSLVKTSSLEEAAASNFTLKISVVFSSET